ncbi:MAG: hypothetical protein JOY90_00620 [Bradyrhizobium sp.]|uniref:hypothetical protein n=1 Tax=Bradyrhizobium sp. TaxID=376 RepID=UPI001DA356B7|nr:hypothetical protein [Bradyrhizobium sp.]MBV9558959.1 hypothetical protein [Bradyrhizobium sp.]
MSLGEGKQAHDNQSHQDTSGYDVLHHGRHSKRLTNDVVSNRAAKIMNVVGAAVNAHRSN